MSKNNSIWLEEREREKSITHIINTGINLIKKRKKITFSFIKNYKNIFTCLKIIILIIFFLFISFIYVYFYLTK
jgi:hypothetical protein